MIGLDTNILLRLWLNDDPAQNKYSQLTAIRSLLDETAFAFEDKDTVRRASVLFEEAS